MADTTAAPATGKRKTQIGNVASSRMNKTIVVEVTRKKAHPMYGRVVAHTKKFYAHDEDNTAHAGDVVKIEETRPLSKTKRWRLVEIIKKAHSAEEKAAEKTEEKEK